MGEGLVYSLILLWVITVIFTTVLAVRKSYNGFLAFLLGLLPLLGLLIIALLPNKYEMESKHEEVKLSSLSIVNKGDTWICKNCEQENPSTSSTCKGCGEYK
jgi:hypothetical protein